MNAGITVLLCLAAFLSGYAVCLRHSRLDGATAHERFKRLEKLAHNFADQRDAEAAEKRRAHELIVRAIEVLGGGQP